MDLDYDLRLRLALFEHVDRLRRELGGVVTSARLNEGFEFEGRRIPIWNQQQGIFRPAALRARISTPASDPSAERRPPFAAPSSHPLRIFDGMTSGWRIHGSRG